MREVRKSSIDVRNPSFEIRKSDAQVEVDELEFKYSMNDIVVAFREVLKTIREMEDLLKLNEEGWYNKDWQQKVEGVYNSIHDDIKSRHPEFFED